MLTWLIPVARTTSESHPFAPIGQVADFTLRTIGFAYELSPARVPGGGGRRGILHPRSPAARDHAAVALAAHQDARGRARRCGARPAAPRGLPDACWARAPPRGADRGAGTRARPPDRPL